MWEADSTIYGSGTGTYSIDGQDPTDSDLTDTATDALELTGIGKKGNSIQKVQVTLVPMNRSMSCLESGLHSGGNMTFNTATVTFNGIISTNDNVIEIGSSSIDANADVEAVNTIVGDDFGGTLTPGSDPRDLPNITTAFDYYKTMGLGSTSTTSCCRRLRPRRRRLSICSSIRDLKAA